MYSKLTPIRPMALNPTGESFADPKGWTDECTSGTGPVSVEVTMDYDTWESTVAYFAVYLTASTEYTFYGTGTYSNARIDVYNSAGTKVAYNQGNMTEPDWEWVVSDCVYTPSESGVYVFAVLDGSEMGDMGGTYNMYVTPRPSDYSMLGPTPYEKSNGFLDDGSILRVRSAFTAGTGPNMPSGGLVLHLPMHSNDEFAETGQALSYYDIKFELDASLGVSVAKINGAPALIEVDGAGAMPTGAAPRTVSLWLKGGLVFQKIFAGLYMNGSNGKIAVTGTAPASSILFDYALTANTWQHIAYTYDGSGLIYYVDGQAVATGTATSIEAQKPLMAFADSYPYTGYLVGARIYNVALAQWAIARLASEFTVSS